MTAGVLIAALGTPLAMDPWGFNSFGPAKALVLSIGVGLTLLGVLSAPAQTLRQAASLLSTRSTQLLLALAGVTVLSAVVSVDVRQSFFGSYPEYRGLALLVAGMFVALGAALARLHVRPSVLARTMLAVLGLICTYALVQRVGLDPMSYRETLDLARARSTLGNASNLGAWLVLALPLMWVLADRAGHLERRLRWPVAAAALVVLVWTGSRGAWIGMSVALVLGAALVIWRRRNEPGYLIKVAGASVAGAAVALVGAALNPSIVGRLAGVSFTSDAAEWRFSLWRSAWQMALDRPVLGWGPDTFRLVYPSYREPALSELSGIPQVSASAHNLLMDTASASGLVAGALLVVIAAYLFVRGVMPRGMSDSPVAMAAVVALLGTGVALSFHFVTLDHVPLLAMAFGIVIAEELERGAGAKPEGSGKGPQRTAGTGGSGHLVVGAVIACALLFGTVGLVLADRAVGRMFSLAASGAEWSELEPQARRAARTAPWDPAFVWAGGRAASDVLVSAADRSAYEFGVHAFQTAERRSPLDVTVRREHGDFLLNAGQAFGDRALVEAAVVKYGEAAQMDPFNAVPLIGQGVAHMLLGDSPEAVVALRKATELAPRSQPAWANLEEAYRQLGDVEAAAEADVRARSLEREGPGE